MGVGSLSVTKAVAHRNDRQMEGEKERQGDPSCHPEQGLPGVLQRPQRSSLFCGGRGCFLKPSAWKPQCFFLFILPCGGCGLWEHKAAAGVLLGPQEPRPMQAWVAGNLQAMRKFLQFPPENGIQRPCNILKPPLARVTVQPSPCTD